MKQPYSAEIKQWLPQQDGPLLRKLTIGERPGKWCCLGLFMSRKRASVRSGWNRGEPDAGACRLICAVLWEDSRSLFLCFTLQLYSSG